MVRSTKQTKSVARKSEDNEEQSRPQQQRCILDAFPRLEEDQLTPNEMWWSQHFDWLKDCGYLLRPRYAPNWVPSWKGTKKERFSCEDSIVPMVGVHEENCVVPGLFLFSFLPKYLMLRVCPTAHMSR